MYIVIKTYLAGCDFKCHKRFWLLTPIGFQMNLNLANDIRVRVAGSFELRERHVERDY
jgi:hypothetical protein